MKIHVRIYFDYFGYGEQDFIPCEICKSRSTDIHHVKYKSRGGQDDIGNLMALCRKHHNQAHNEILKENELREIHYKFLENNTQ